MSESKVQCESCLNFFTLKFIEFHKKKCLSQKEEFCCEYCENKFASKRNLERHIASCKFVSFVKEIDSLKQTQNELESQIKCLEKELSLSNEEINKTVNEFNEKIKKIKNEHENYTQIICKEYNLKIEKLEEKISAYKEKENLLFDQIRTLKVQKSSSVTVNNNITYNTQINALLANLEPIKQDDLAILIRDIISNPLLPDNPSHFAANVHNRYLKPRIIKSDSARKVINWKDENNKIIKDPKAKVLTEKILDVGKPFFEEKIVQLEQDRLSPSAHPVVIESIINWIDVCHSLASKSDNCKRDFAAKIAELSDDKALFQANPPEEKELSDVEQFFYNIFYNDTNFILFTGDIKGFGYMLKNFYEDHWVQGVHEIELRITRQDEFRPLPFDNFKSVCFGLISNSNYFKILCKNFSRFDGEITCWVEGYQEKTSRGKCLDLVETTLSKLVESDDTWETIYNILLGIE